MPSESSNLTPSQQRVIDALVELGDGWADILSIARAAGRSDRKLRAHVARLVEMGCVTRRQWRDPSAGRGRRKWLYRRAGAQADSIQHAEPEEAKPFTEPVVPYMEALADFQHWCEGQGLDFREQVTEAVRNHIKHKDSDHED